MSIAIDTYHRYDELTALLHELHERYPKLCTVLSIGKSYEGRHIWAVQLTNPDTGAPESKPGYYIDANIHAGEVTGCATALYTIQYLLANYGTDPECTRLLDELTWYVIPRVNPDGAELYLTTPYMLRSSVRPYPLEEPQDGLQQEDIDGDGEILMMRWEDADGEWKVSEQDPRLMVPRAPHESGSTYYRVLHEGILQHFNGVEVKLAQPRHGLDLNRNFPANWAPEAQQTGAGPYPMSEPETRAQAEFILGHPNIFGAQAYHTTSGYILRPAATRKDDKLPRADLAAMKAIGEVGEQLTGYPCVSCLEGFAADSSKPLKGVFMEWLYDHLGLLVYSTELWDFQVRAGLSRFPFGTRTEAEGLKLLQWNDQELAGEGFKHWTACDHPQLGKVEVGGWRFKFVLQNPPVHLLKQEAHKNMKFTFVHAGAAPRLRIERSSVEQVGQGVYKVTVVLKNKGYLPTNVTEQAKLVKAARPIKVELQLPEGAEVVLGKSAEEVGHLDGRVNAAGVQVYWWGTSVQQREHKLEWVVRAPQGGKLTVSASAQKAGHDRAELELR